LAALNNYIDTINSSELFIEEHIYLNMDRIVDKIRNRARFMEQKVHFDVRSDFEIRAIVNPKADKTSRYNLRVFPKWLQL